VVGGAPPQLAAEGSHGRVIVDDHQLDAGHLGEVLEGLDVEGLGQDGVVRRTRHQPRLRGDGPRRPGTPDRAGDGQAWERLVRVDHVDRVHRQAEPVA
jgi:hypothetical protein